MKQTPSIGRVVHYILSQRESPTNAGVPRPAIINSVRDDGSCGLTVFCDSHHDQASAVVYVKAAHLNEGEGNKPGTWRWPPYVAPQASIPDRARAIAEETKPALGEETESEETPFR